ncbi:MAG TPA: 2-phospho-L-lactate guanylyltransferase [Mycobacteriales bacterium]|nr:2-phospho-L-lactate guanylyltransferase [Mycobacteriales bacterium]
MTGARWVVVVPVKELPVAKTRLGLPDARRTALALAMACDVVAAAAACPLVDGVVAVTNDLRAAAALEPLGARVVADTADAGLNPALADGARLARALWPRHGVATLGSDLPCARPDELAAALAAAAAFDRAVLPDARGDGTTLLTAGPGTDLDPRYGRASRAAHVAAGAVQLTPGAWPSLERDVDTPADLAAAVALGVGPATRAALDSPGD